MDTKLVLAKIIFFCVPGHANELRELRESRCTGFCRSLKFIRDASEKVKNLTLCMVIASLVSLCRGEAISKAVEVVKNTSSLIIK